MEDRFGDRAVVELGYTNAPEIVPRLAAAFEAGPQLRRELRDFINYLQDLESDGRSGRLSPDNPRACATSGGAQQLLQEGDAGVGGRALH